MKGIHTGTLLGRDYGIDEPPRCRANAALLCCFGLALLSQPRVVSAADGSRMEDLLSLPLEDLLEVRVDVGSQFNEPQLQSGSTVVGIAQEQWQKRGARRLHDAIGFLPATLVLPNWFGAEQIMIRGYANGNNSSGVATLWDGVPLNGLEGSPQFFRTNINLGTLDRIEMIRGPGSALYGENAFHGVFSLRAFESEHDMSRVNAGLANNGYYEAALKHSQQAWQGVRVNISAAHSAQPGQDIAYDYTDPPGSSERDYSYQSSTAVVKLVSDPQRTLSWRAGLYWDDNRSKDYLSAGTSGPSGLDYRDLGGVDSEFSMATAAAAYRVKEGMTATLEGYYWTQRRVFERAFSLTRDFQGKGNQEDAATTLTLKQERGWLDTQWSVAFAARFQNIGNAQRRITEGETVVINDRLAFSDFNRRINSVSFDASTPLGDSKLQLRYGGRFDDYSDFGSQTSPRLGLVYQPTAGTAVKLLYGNAFRAPGALEVNGAAAIASNASIKPETLDSYELVFMKQTRHTLSELVFFESRWEDSIVVSTASPAPGFFGKYVNSGSSRSHGVEANFAYQTDPWTVELSGSYVQSRNEDQKTDYGAFPTWIFNAGVGYRWLPYQTDFYLNNRVHLDAKEGQVATTLPDPHALKDYFRTDLHIGKRFTDKWSAFLDVRNLFDRQNYLPSIQANPSPGGIPDEERSLRIGAHYQM